MSVVIHALQRLGERRATMALESAAALVARPFDLKLCAEAHLRPTCPSPSLKLCKAELVDSVIVLDAKALLRLHTLRLNEDVDQIAASGQPKSWMAATIAITFVCPPKSIGRSEEPYSDIETFFLSGRYVDSRVCGESSDVVDFDRFPA
jgi:hypothetical protein